MSDSQQVSDQVVRLREIEALTASLLRSPKALRYWNLHNPTGHDLPGVYLCASGGFQEVTGLVIGGTWEPEDGWQYDCEFAMFTEHGDILTCHGWNLEVEEL